MGGDRVRHHLAIMEFSRGNMFGGAVFGTYGPFWVIFGAFQTLYATAGGWVVLVFAVLACPRRTRLSRPSLACR